MGPLVLFLLLILATHMPQITPGFWGMSTYAPDLWVLLALYLAFRGRGFQAVGWAILIGVARDATSLDPLGTSAFVLGFVAWVFAEGNGQRGRIEGGSRLVLTFVGVVVAGWVYAFRVLPMGQPLEFAALLGAFPVALWSTLFAAGLFALLDQQRLLDDIAGRRHALSA